MITAWPGEQSRMSAEELQTVTFPMSRRGRRGYDEDSVRDFLRTVHAQYVRLLTERTSLWQEVHLLRRRLISGRANGEPRLELPGPAGPHGHAVRMLSAAQVTADRYVADARAYSSRLTDEARARRDEIIQDALRYSDALLDEAHASACEAADSALTTEHSPESESEQEPGPAELAYLRTYSDAYRAHLQAYTDTVLSSIEELAHTTTISLDQEQVAQLPDATAAYIS